MEISHDNSVQIVCHGCSSMLIRAMVLYVLPFAMALIYRRHAYLVQKHVRNVTTVLQVTIICLIWTYQKRKNQRYHSIHVLSRIYFIFIFYFWIPISRCTHHNVEAIKPEIFMRKCKRKRAACLLDWPKIRPFVFASVIGFFQKSSAYINQRRK